MKIQEFLDKTEQEFIARKSLKVICHIYSGIFKIY